jgi:hypothetical protein
MGFANGLKNTAIRLLIEYGNLVVLSTKTNDAVYNPQTGQYGSETVVEYNKLAAVSNASNEELKGSGIPEGEWGNIKAVYTMVEDNETSQITNEWFIDGNPIKKVAPTQAQNTVVVLKVYVG